MDGDSPQCCSWRGAWWRLPLLLLLLLAAIVMMRGRGIRNTSPDASASATSNPVADPAREHVSLAIDFGDGRRQDFDALAWHEEMTVADLVSSATGLTTTQKGSAQAALLTAINGVANEGADGKNWMYDVNGKRGDRSFAVFELQPGDRVLWTFEPRR